MSLDKTIEDVVTKYYVELDDSTLEEEDSEPSRIDLVVEKLGKINVQACGGEGTHQPEDYLEPIQQALSQMGIKMRWWSDEGPSFVCVFQKKEN